MINFIQVCNLKQGSKVVEKYSNVFVLNTCQRTLIVSISCHHEYFEIKKRYSDVILKDYKAEKAYKFLLEIICGLQSRLLGENEIINQFKKAYLEYLKNPTPNSIIMKFMEKLFQDAKLIRNKHLNSVHQVSYSSITRQIIKQHSNSKRILILGTGKLAEDLAKTIIKRYNVYIKGRNQERLAHLSETYNAKILGWESDYNDPQLDSSLMIEFPVIINTIGAPLKQLSQDFFSAWKAMQTNILFIDLASPTYLPQDILQWQEVFDLNQIFVFAEQENKQKNSLIQQALLQIDQITENRKISMAHSIPYAWDDLIQI